jgi:hypothetical protein
VKCLVRISARTLAIQTEVSRGFLSSCRKLRGFYLGSDPIASFHVISNSLFTNRPTIQRYIYWATDGVAKLTKNLICFKVIGIACVSRGTTGWEVKFVLEFVTYEMRNVDRNSTFELTLLNSYCTKLTAKITREFRCITISVQLLLNQQKYFFTDSVVRIATGYGLDNGGIAVRVPVGSRIFSSPRRPDRFWGPTNLLSNGYRGLFPRG